MVGTMKSWYSVAFIIEGSVRDEIQRAANSLEEKFSVINPTRICVPHIAIQAPFLLESIHEEKLIELVTEKVFGLTQVPFLSPVSGPRFYNSLGTDKYLVIVYKDMVADIAHSLRISVVNTLESAFPQILDYDRKDSEFYTVLAGVSENFGAVMGSLSQFNILGLPQLRSVGIIRSREGAAMQEPWHMACTIPIRGA
jgi:hypothetical protein